MGIGDEIMVTGEVKRKLRANPNYRKVCIYDPRPARKPHRWEDIWDGNPHIAKPGERYDDIIINCGGNRPYIQSKGPSRWCWKEYAPEPGAIYLRPMEREYIAYGADYIVIQPTIKSGASPNKQWGLDRWQDLVDLAPNIRWLQIGGGSEPRLRRVDFLATPSFRHACAVLKGARGAVLHEGGLHHAAAAVGRASVVVYGGYISPRCTGYAMHHNIFVDPDGDMPLGCGDRSLCKHCHRVMSSIKPNHVLAELEALLCKA